jgi:hypothetical protein
MVRVMQLSYALVIASKGNNCIVFENLQASIGDLEITVLYLIDASVNW